MDAEQSDEASRIVDHEFTPINNQSDDGECTHRAPGTGATYCGRPQYEHRWWIHSAPEIVTSDHFPPTGQIDGYHACQPPLHGREPAFLPGPIWVCATCGQAWEVKVAASDGLRHWYPKEVYPMELSEQQRAARQVLASYGITENSEVTLAVLDAIAEKSR